MLLRKKQFLVLAILVGIVGISIGIIIIVKTLGDLLNP